MKNFARIHCIAQWRSESINKTKVESVQLGKPPTEPRVLRKVCVVVGGGGDGDGGV